MRATLLAVGASVCLIACGGTNQGDVRHHNGDDGAPSQAQNPPSQSGGTGPASACPAGIPAAVQLAPDGAATDVSFVGPAVYFRSATKISRVNTDGSALAKIYESADLVRSYADAQGILVVTSPDGTSATLDILTLEGKSAGGAPPPADPNTKGGLPGLGGAVPTGTDAASTFIIGSDPTAYYLLVDGAQDVVYKFDKTARTFAAIATLDGVVSDAQIANGALWYVRDQKRVFMLDLTATQTDPADKAGATPGEMTEVFGIGYDACSLAVGSVHAYCATSGVIEQRDLKGGNPKSLLEAKNSKVSSPFGTAKADGDGLLVQSSTGDAALKSVVRGVSAAGDEHLVACGRDPISTFATDGKNVAWAETGKGLFVAPR